MENQKSLINYNIEDAIRLMNGWVKTVCGLEARTERINDVSVVKIPIPKGGIPLLFYEARENGIKGPDPRQYSKDKSCIGALVADMGDLFSLFGFYFNPETGMYDTNGTVVVEQTF